MSNLAGKIEEVAAPEGITESGRQHRGMDRYRLLKYLFHQDGCRISEASTFIDWAEIGSVHAHEYLAGEAQCHMINLIDGRVFLSRIGTVAVVDAYPELLKDAVAVAEALDSF